MPIDNERLAELRTTYRNTLITIVDEFAAAHRSSAGAKAVKLIKFSLGMVDESCEMLDSAARPVLVEYVIALRGVLKQMAGADTGEENQAVIQEFERALGGLL